MRLTISTKLIAAFAGLLGLIAVLGLYSVSRTSAMREDTENIGQKVVPGTRTIGELARRRDVPVQFLEQLFAVLRRAGILRSQRGVKGGYAFAREPGEVTVLEVVELLDGRLGAEAEGIFAEAAAAARAVLAKTTILDVVDRENQAAGATMYYI